MTDPLIDEKKQPKLREFAEAQAAEKDARLVVSAELTELAEAPEENGLPEKSVESMSVPRPSIDALQSTESDKKRNQHAGRQAESSHSFEFPDDAPFLEERYELLERIGEGAMGTVWKVFDKSLNQTFALKTLRPELLQDPEAVQRFEQEAHLAVELEHPHIAAVYGPGKDIHGRPYIIMDFIDGESLASILAREGKLEVDRALNITQQICEALSCAHMHGIVHRDIKPSNILITKTESGADVVSVVDFGIARSIYEEVHLTQALTRPMGDFATPTYMSPEQCMGHPVTAHSDIYSLGCVLFEMLTGLPPFTEKNQVRLIVQHLNEEPVLSSIPLQLHTLMASCLAKGIDLRPKTADELNRSIEKVMKHGDRFGPIAPTPPTVSFATMLLIFPSLVSQIDGPLERVLTAALIWLFLGLSWGSLINANRSTLLRTKEQSAYEKALAALLLVLPLEFAILPAPQHRSAPFITQGIVSGIIYFLILPFLERSKWYEKIRKLLSKSQEIDNAGVRNIISKGSTEICIPLFIAAFAGSIACNLALYAWQPIAIPPAILNNLSILIECTMLMPLLHACTILATKTQVQSTNLWPVALKSLKVCSVQFLILLMASLGVLLTAWGSAIRDIGLISAVSHSTTNSVTTQSLLRTVVNSSRPLPDSALGDAYVMLAGGSILNATEAHEYLEKCLRLLESHKIWTTPDLPIQARSRLGIEYSRTNCALDVADGALRLADTNIASRALATINHSPEPLSTRQWQRVHYVQEECAKLNSIKQLDTRANGSKAEQ